jgi:hypothetical protein
MDPVPNIWLRDLRTDRLEHISVNYLGQPADNISGSYRTDISADGRYVAFDSDAKTLLLGSGPGFDTYLWSSTHPR